MFFAFGMAKHHSDACVAMISNAIDHTGVGYARPSTYLAMTFSPAGIITGKHILRNMRGAVTNSSRAVL